MYSVLKAAADILEGLKPARAHALCRLGFLGRLAVESIKECPSLRPGFTVKILKLPLVDLRTHFVSLRVGF